MKQKIFSTLADKLTAFSGKLSAQRHVNALTKTFQAIIPIVTIGSFALLLSRPLINPAHLTEGTQIYDFMTNWLNFITAYGGPLKMVASFTISSIGLYVALGIAYFLADEYKLNKFLSMILSFVSFVTLASTMTEDGGVSIAKFGGEGIFTAMVVAFVATELYYLCTRKNIGKIKLPDSVPPMVATSLSSLIPVSLTFILSIIVATVLKATLGITFPDLIVTVLNPILGPINGIGGVLIFTVLAVGSFWLGIHADAIWALMKPLLYANLAVNAEAYLSGTALTDLPHIVTTSFVYNFCVIGGCGATLGLAFLLITSKSKELKAIGKIGIIPSLFNINEPIIFGVPIMLNPTFLIPFIGAQAVNAIISFIAMTFHLVNRTYAYPGNIMPVGLPTFLASLDWRSVALVALLIVIDLLIYFPFFKVYEKQKIAEENAVENAQ